MRSEVMSRPRTITEDMYEALSMLLTLSNVSQRNYEHEVALNDTRKAFSAEKCH